MEGDMKKNHILPLFLLLSLSSCGGKPIAPASSSEESSEDASSQEAISSPEESSESEEQFISLFSDKSRLYFESLKEEESCPLKTYRHKDFGEIPYVSIAEYAGIFPISSLRGARNVAIAEGKCIVSNGDLGAFVFNAEEDTVTTAPDVLYFFKDNKVLNDLIPLDIYVPRDFERFSKGSPKTHYVKKGQERVYDCKKYNFDIVYENDAYYAPFSLLNSLFFEYGNETCIYNGSDYFDVDGLTGGYPTVQYCYSSKGSFLLDQSEGKLGALLFENKTPLEGQDYRFEATIEASGQRFVFELAAGKGFLRSYDSEGKLIEEGTFTKVKYEVKDNLMILRYFSVLDENDDEDKTISDIHTLTIHMDETNFLKKQRSQIVADFSYQELRFAMYELYGETRNEAVRDFDAFIQDKPYKADLLSLDCKTYDEAMAKFLLQGIDDCHTTIGTTSIYDLPTMANGNAYSSTLEGPRYDAMTSLASKLRGERADAGVSEGLDIVGETAFLTFDKFAFDRASNGVLSLKGFKEYKGTDPKSYVQNNTMEFFASSFNKIAENAAVKNVVFDLACNTGGKTATMAYLISYMTDDPSIVVKKGLNGSIIDYHYRTDLDQDGIYGSSTDTFKGKYNFFVLTSGASFSCGTHFPTICKDGGYARIIGQQSGGGSSSISQISNATGFIYYSSSENTAMLKDGQGGYAHNDYGVPVDLAIDRSLWFDHAQLDALLKQ